MRLKVKMKIQLMQEADLDFAAECTRMEGWTSEKREDFEVFLNYPAEGCFIAFDQGKRIGICFATPYDHFGFVGQLIVIPNKRGRGFGAKLLLTAVEYLQHRGIEDIFLDGVPLAMPLYERAGFQKVCPSNRFIGSPNHAAGANVRKMTMQDWQAITRMDREAFGADREYFLSRRLANHPSLCLVLEEKGQIQGYLMGKARENLVVAGPWIVEETAAHPENLLTELAKTCPGLPIRIGVLSDNEKAIRLLRTLNFQENHNPPTRMRLGPATSRGVPGRCFAIGSPAKG